MKISIYDQDVALAAHLAVYLKRELGDSADVNYVEDLEDESLAGSDILIADPAPYTTAGWLTRFRERHKTMPLILISNNTDLISASWKDPSYAMGKPVNAPDILMIIRSITLGKLYSGGSHPLGDRKSN